jgi:hypothetical protein
MALTFPRVPEAVVPDRGVERYDFFTPPLDTGAVAYAVVPVDDEGDLLAAPAAAADSPKQIYSPPAPVTGLGVTGNASALTAVWTPGEPGCSFKVYRGRLNAPINFGTLTTPAPITTAVDAVDSGAFDVTPVTPDDFEPDYNDLKTVFDTEGPALASEWLGGEAGFEAAVNTFETNLLAAIAAFGTALNASVVEFSAALASIAISLRDAFARNSSGLGAGFLVDGDYFAGEQAITLDTGTGSISNLATVDFAGDATVYPVAGFAGGVLQLEIPLQEDLADNSAVTVNPLSAGDWEEAMRPAVLDALAAIGAMLDGEAARYIPAGEVYAAGPAAPHTLRAIAEPFLQNKRLHICVHSVKDGVEEMQGARITVEFDAGGEPLDPRPNAAMIEEISFRDGLTVVALIAVLDEAPLAVATVVDLYVVAEGDEIDIEAPAASEDLPAALMGYHRKEVAFEVPAAGNYRIAAAARTAGGMRSALTEIEVRYVSDDAAVDVDELAAEVVR